MRLLLASSTLATWVGLTLLLSELRWFARRPLAERLGPYLPGGMARPGRVGILSVASFRDAVGPVARSVGEAFSRLTGATEELDRRLRRIHAPLDATAFRVRQIGWAFGGLVFGGLLSVIWSPPALLRTLPPVGGLLLASLLVEQQVVLASQRWKRSLHLELPVVAEQLGMLLAAGYSLVSALDRVASRGRGVSAEDLRVVLSRIRHGVPEHEALREWGDVAQVEAVDRLVAVLALHREASDLSRLIATEARAMRRDLHRELLETLERRGQQVWIPVTVATLLPGVIFIAIPFRAALSGFLT